MLTPAPVRNMLSRIDVRWLLLLVVVWNVWVVFLSSPAEQQPASTSARTRHTSTRAHAKHRAVVPDTDVIGWLKSPGNTIANARPGSAQNAQDAEIATAPAAKTAFARVADTNPGLVEDSLLSIRSTLSSSTKSLDSKLDDVVARLQRLDVSLTLAQSLSSSRTGGGSERRQKQTLFLPIGPNDLGRFQNMYASMVKFFDFDSVHEWLVVTPTRDSDVARGILETTKQHAKLIKILEDTELVPKLKELPTTNWMTQQVLKLGAADRVQTPFYFVMDADLICFKPTSLFDLVINGKALTNVYDSMVASTREEWWRSAEKVLDMSIVSPTFVGVTPMFLATDVVKQMRSRLEKIHSKDWSTFLLENVYTYTFTEYTMYGVFAQASGLYARFHISLPNSVYNHDKSMWFESQFDSIDFASLLRDAPYLPGHFIVMQSNTEISASDIKARMGNLFD